MSVRCTASCRGSSASRRTAVRIARSVSAALRLMGEEPRQPLERHLAQPLALGGEPLLEERLSQAEAQQEIAAVDLGRSLERRRRPVEDVPLEGGRVDLDRGGIERERVARHPQAPRVGAGEGAPEGGQGVAQAVPRSIVALLAPQDGGERVAPVALARAQAQVGEEGLGLPPREPQGLIGREPGLETAEESHGQARRSGLSRGHGPPTIARHDLFTPGDTDRTRPSG